MSNREAHDVSDIIDGLGWESRIAHTSHGYGVEAFHVSGAMECFLVARSAMEIRLLLEAELDLHWGDSQ